MRAFTTPSGGTVCVKREAVASGAEYVGSTWPAPDISIHLCVASFNRMGWTSPPQVPHFACSTLIYDSAVRKVGELRATRHPKMSCRITLEVTGLRRTTLNTEPARPAAPVQRIVSRLCRVSPSCLRTMHQCQVQGTPLCQLSRTTIPIWHQYRLHGP